MKSKPLPSVNKHLASMIEEVIAGCNGLDGMLKLISPFHHLTAQQTR